MNYSIIIPVYNRPQELEELLESLVQQSFKDFEVIVVEDGSEITSSVVVQNYSEKLTIQYLYKENTGPGLTRNYGVENANFDYFVFLDSDTVLPKNYLEEVDTANLKRNVDAFGGPDRAHKSFTKIQKAINYSMTSFLLTGGIRGGSYRLDKYYPRSFNMGFTRKVFKQTGGFSNMRYGEDIDLSIRIVNKGFKTALFENAFVFHKRRTNLLKFFWQVFNSGKARISLQKTHPGSLKSVHAFPLLAILLTIVLIVLAIEKSIIFLAPVFIIFVLILFDAAIKNRNLLVGLLSILTSAVQIAGYGLGFFVATLRRITD